MLDDGPDAKTYRDLMQLLPDVAKILLWWARDEDGIPHSISRAAFYGHDQESLIEIEVEDVEDDEESAGFNSSYADQPLRDRFLGALMVLNWLDASSLAEEANATVILLPSPSHVPDAPPLDWGEP